MVCCYALCGIPGSGKTTLAKQLAEQYGAIVHSYDDVPGAWGTPDCDGAFQKAWMGGIKADLRAGKSVICDSTMLTSSSRNWFLAEVAEFGCRTVLIAVVTPVEECLRRNSRRERCVPEHQIRLTAKLFEPPAADEGWNEVYVCRE